MLSVVVELVQGPDKGNWEFVVHNALEARRLADGPLCTFGWPADAEISKCIILAEALERVPSPDAVDAIRLSRELEELMRVPQGACKKMLLDLIILTLQPLQRTRGIKGVKSLHLIERARQLATVLGPCIDADKLLETYASMEEV